MIKIPSLRGGGDKQNYPSRSAFPFFSSSLGVSDHKTWVASKTGEKDFNATVQFDNYNDDKYSDIPRLLQTLVFPEPYVLIHITHKHTNMIKSKDIKCLI